MEKLFKAIGKYLTWYRSRKSPRLSRKLLRYRERCRPAQKFYKELPAELRKSSRRSNVRPRRIKEISQLILGKAATAGLKDVAPSGQVVTSGRSERFLDRFFAGVSEFARDSQPESQRQPLERRLQPHADRDCRTTKYGWLFQSSVKAGKQPGVRFGIGAIQNNIESGNGEIGVLPGINALYSLESAARSISFGV